MADTDVQRPASPMSALAWGALVIGGIFAIIIGLVAIIWPSVTFTVLVVLLGVFAFISGLFTVLVGAVWPPGWGVRGLMLLEGVLGIVVGVLIFLRPESAAIALSLSHRCVGHHHRHPPDSSGSQVAQGDRR